MPASLLEPNWVMDHGLSFQAVVGFVAPRARYLWSPDACHALSPE
jgi:hypothetical protein